MQAIAAVVFADLLACKFQRVLVSPAQHSLKVLAPLSVDQYVRIISG
jgi:hypothetical protein